jgi:hypothetical protein
VHSAILEIRPPRLSRPFSMAEFERWLAARHEKPASH